jgi:hypothetical protein
MLRMLEIDIERNDHEYILFFYVCLLYQWLYLEKNKPRRLREAYPTLLGY